MNSRFLGTWLLDSYETLLTDGTVAHPWGDDPVGIIYWDASGYFAVQVGQREAGDGGDYISFFGTAEASDGESGRIVLRVEGSSLPGRVNGDQVRDFLFLEPGLLRMRPPLAPNGVQGTLMWRRAKPRNNPEPGSERAGHEARVPEVERTPRRDPCYSALSYSGAGGVNRSVQNLHKPFSGAPVSSSSAWFT